jgi:phage-related protein
MINPLFGCTVKSSRRPFLAPPGWKQGFLLRKLQRGDTVLMPHARPMPSIGPRCYELRVNDENKTWRIIYRIDLDAVVICEVFEKKTPRTPKSIIAVCQQRLRRYDADAE